ncbi:membrane protein [Zunongwangia profunda SM-A87]|uniref:Membrane protein n=1 Tax=Zunongwangia profunda (strain DSM 18752 / CCTCC AB 206139 / SM-A87) TaxID=655815 RepID=D5BAA4_ZUNPS|nr:membrane protein [Zunongwangia profunda SM-A87]
MESFSIKKLWKAYLALLYKDSNNLKERIATRLVLPLGVSFILLFTIESISEVKNTISVVLSILIGLLFNFVSSFSDRIRSDHLIQNASEKIKRLKLIRETSDGAFVTIFLSLMGLGILLIITLTSGNFILRYLKIDQWTNLFFSGICLTLLYQIFLMLIYMVNRLRKLIKVDTKQEEQYLESKQEQEINDFEEFED